MVARDPHGTETSGPIWSFSTVAVSSFAVSAEHEGIDVTWRLVSDEGMQSYTLYRKHANEQPLALATGAVTSRTGSFLDGSVMPGVSYTYELSVINDAGDDLRSSVARISAWIPKLDLSPNHPNPFNPQTTIPYFLMVGGYTRLTIYDLSGRQVRTLVDGQQLWGAHEVIWNGMDDAGMVVASGVYFAVLRDSRGERVSRKLMMMK